MPTLENAHALIVGIANYASINNLPRAVLNDARAVHSVITDQGISGYQKKNVQLLLDKEATGQALRAGLEKLAQRATATSSVFIYLSCHGGRLEAGPVAGDYLLPVDTVYDPEPRFDNAVSAAELALLLDKIRSQKMVVVLDCCHAGGIIQPPRGQDQIAKAVLAPAELKPFTREDYQALINGRGRAVLAAARGSEYSWILNDDNSLFTGHMLDGLRGNAVSEDGMIRIFELFSYIQPRVTRARKDQHPVLEFKGEENFAVALYPGQRTNPLPLFDAYLSYAEADEKRVWEELLPYFRNAGLKVATSLDSADPGVPRVVNMQQGVKSARHTVVVLSPNWFKDRRAELESLLRMDRNIEEGTWSLVPLKMSDYDRTLSPDFIEILEKVDLTKEHGRETRLSQLTEHLRRPAPRWHSSSQ